jgi:hypothetical protein
VAVKAANLAQSAFDYLFKGLLFSVIIPLIRVARFWKLLEIVEKGLLEGSEL